MPPRRRTGRRILKAFLPIAFVLVLAVIVVTGLIVYCVTRPPRNAYLVTPEKFSILSARGLKATDERWSNRDGTQARGWLLRGGEGAPAVILLHRYGADRSSLLNLGVKLNETTNYTVLWPDLRGHGLDPPVKWTSFGTREAEDVGAALQFLRELKTQQGKPLIGDRVGVYGVELGGYAALQAAASDAGIHALVLDSVPARPNDLLRAATKECVNEKLDNRAVQWLARMGVRLYFLGHYENRQSCAAASVLTDRRVLLLTGEGAHSLRDSTVALAKCFPNPSNVELQSDLPLIGYNLQSTGTGEQSEAYDRRVIDFFDRTLSLSP
jgi:pimeloyl-ACP methyl ester carboxylesterase